MVKGRLVLARTVDRHAQKALFKTVHIDFLGNRRAAAGLDGGFTVKDVRDRCRIAAFDVFGRNLDVAQHILCGAVLDPDFAQIIVVFIRFGQRRPAECQRRAKQQRPPNGEFHSVSLGIMFFLGGLRNRT